MIEEFALRTHSHTFSADQHMEVKSQQEGAVVGEYQVFDIVWGRGDGGTGSETVSEGSMVDRLGIMEGYGFDEVRWWDIMY